VGTFTNNNPANPYNNVKAGLAYILFDEQFNYAGGGFDPVLNDPAKPSGGLKPHFLQDIPVPKNGYIYIYCSNESNKDVFFDNVEVVHQRSPILEETHYTAWGSKLLGISAQAANGIKNNFNYTGKELQNAEWSDGSGLEEYDYGARFLDPQLGIWHSIDPMAFKYSGYSPYVYTFNNPLRYIDPTGMDGVKTNDEDQMVNFIRVKNTKTGEITDVITGNAEDGARESYTEVKENSNGGVPSIGIIMYNCERSLGEAMKAKIPGAIVAIMPSGAGQGGIADFLTALKQISDASPNGIGYLAIFSHGGLNNSSQGAIFPNAKAAPTALNIYTSDLAQVATAVKNLEIKFASFATIYLGACNGGTFYPDGKSFAMELSRATETFVTAVSGQHMNAFNLKDILNTKFLPERGGILMSYYGGKVMDSAFPRIPQIIDVAADATRWIQIISPRK
jgi:RHS repeat-associated protein